MGGILRNVIAHILFCCPYTGAFLQFPIINAPVAAPALGENTQTLIFKDVVADNPNAVYIKYIVARGLITGFPDGGYHPTEALTRAQAAALLAKIAGLDTKTGGNSGFKDVPATYWAAGSIAAASKAGYIKGMGNGQFQPNKKLTRAQGISLFLSLSKQADPGVALPALSDINSQHWAARPVAIALDAGMIGLSSDKKKFYPDAEFSRGDLARMLALLLTNDPDLSRSNLSAALVVKKGEVSLQTTGKAEAKTVSASTAINPGDTVITGESGEAEINLPDGSGLLLKANTILTLKNNQGRSYIKKDGSIGSGIEVLEVELKQGRIFGALASRPGIDSQIAAVKDKAGYLVASLAAHFGLAAADKKVPWYKTAQNKKVKVKVDMPWGICGIRGSFWSNVVSATENSTSLLSGEAEVSAANKSQPLAPGQSTTITGSGQAPTPATTMSPEEQKAWDQEKTWVDQKQVQINQNQELIPNTPATIEAPKTPKNPLYPSSSSNEADDNILAAGWGNSFAITADGALWGWGYNMYGQLGNGTTENQLTPIMVMTDVKSVATGHDHTLAIKKDGTLWVWGNNFWGQLGNGTSNDKTNPTPVKIMGGVKSVAAGMYHSLAIKEDGTLWAWGYNENGQLCNGTNEKANPTPMKVMSGVKAIAAGDIHTLVIKEDGTLWVYNINRRPPVKLLTGVKSAASFGTQCLALKQDGTLWEWEEYYGKPADNTNMMLNETPIQVMSQVKSIAIGSFIDAAIKTDGTLWVWKCNQDGELGDGTVKTKEPPVKIMSGVKNVATGLTYTLALKEDGTLWSWGANYTQGALVLGESQPGQLGIGPTQEWSILKPVQVVNFKYN